MRVELGVGGGIGALTGSTALEEFEHDVDTDGGGQLSPAAAVRQLVHWRETGRERKK